MVGAAFKFVENDKKESKLTLKTSIKHFVNILRGISSATGITIFTIPCLSVVLHKNKL